jgi:hypothetical protein
MRETEIYYCLVFGAIFGAIVERNRAFQKAGTLA